MENPTYHPRRYPQHNGPKGQVFGGECNRPSCTSQGAVYYNRANHAYNCPACAADINKWPLGGIEACVEVKHPLTLGEMTSMTARAIMAMQP